MRYVGAVSWLLATVVLLLAAGPATGQVGDNVLVQGSPYGAVSDLFFDDSDRLYVLGSSQSLIMDPESGSLIDERCPAVPGETKLTKSAYSRSSSRFGASSPLLKASRAHALNA